ncbi:hypothetical protein [Galactobacter sp.]|uniref:hypothetical protein n=1 Tax=Galactobacter sp. TaxID=2676125 RepID=UPI0025C00F6F|nr:hypothetical protein [Galactobacter sp.]
MKIPLEGDEHVVVRTRAHPRALRGAAWMFLVLMFLLGVVLGLLTRVPSLGPGWATATPYLVGVSWLLAGLAALAWIVMPVLRWLRTRIVITTGTLWTVRGRRTLQRIPFSMVSRVRSKSVHGGGSHGPGTLEVTTPRGAVSIRHCPDVRAAAAIVDQMTQEVLRMQALHSTEPDDSDARHGTTW